MPVLDIFNNDAFTTVSLTEGVEKVETVPNHIGGMGIFTPRPVRTETVAVEQREGTLSVIQTTQRGEPIASNENDKRTLRDFRTARIAKRDRIMASEIQFIREMNEEQAVMEVQAEVARRLSGPNGLLADVETTLENHRLGAIQGIVKDADGSTIVNYFTEFGIGQPAELAFDLANKTDGALRKFVQKEVVRAIRRAAKGARYSGIYISCGDNFWDDLIANAEVRDTYKNQIEARELRAGYDMQEFQFAGVTWSNYVGTDDNSTVAVADDECKIFPVGAGGMFEMAFAPGESIDDVGTLGRERYVKVVPDRDRNHYVDLEVYSYPLALAKRPEVLLRGKRGA